MKRTRIVTLSFVLFALSAFCGPAFAADEDLLHGLWVLNVDQTIDNSPALLKDMPEGEAGVAARNMVKAMLGQMSFEFNASTRQVVFKVGAEVAENGSYKVTAVKGDTVTVDIEGEVSDLVVKNNTLAVSDGEGTFLLFDKRQ